MPVRGPGVRFVLILVIFVLLVLLTHRKPVLMRALAPFDLFTARLTAVVLDWGGVEVKRESAVLSHPAGFGYIIYYQCTGLVPASFLAVGRAVNRSSASRSAQHFNLGSSSPGSADSTSLPPADVQILEYIVRSCCQAREQVIRWPQVCLYEGQGYGLS